MQRRRLNIKLVIWLFGGTVVLAVGVYFLHGFQMTRNAQKLKKSAAQYVSDGELRRAKSTLTQYVQLQPDDGEQLAKLAELAADIAELPAESFDQMSKDWHEAFGMMERTLLKFPEMHDLRRRLIQFSMDTRARRYQDAIAHLEKLIKMEAADRNDQATYCEVLFAEKRFKEAEDKAYQLIGFDGEGFDKSKAIAPDKSKVYVLLAGHLMVDKKDYEIADLVMNQLVEANPDSYEAFLERGRYFFQFRGQRGVQSPEDVERSVDMAEEDLKRALELSPDDLQTNLLAARIKMIRGEWDAAGTLLEHFVEQFPEDPSGYYFLSYVEKNRSDGEDQKERLLAALAHVEKGLKNVPENQSHRLVYDRVDLQISTGELDAAREALSEMRKSTLFSGHLAVLVDLLDAKIHLQNRDTINAASEFERVRPILAAHQHPWAQGLTSQVDAMLGSCYLNAGKPDLARKSFQSAYDLGFRSELVVRALRGTEQKRQTPSENSIQSIINRIAALPIEQRDWSAFEQELDRVIEKSDISDVRAALLRAQVYMSAKEFDRAKQALSDAFKEHSDDPDIWYAIATLRSIQDNPDAGLTTLARAEKKFGDSAKLRIHKARLVAMRNDPATLREDLVVLEEGVDQLTEQEQLVFWEQISRIYTSARLLDDAQRTAQRVADAVPGSLPQFRRLFELAKANTDVDGMKQALAQIEELVGRDDSVWQFCEASRIMFLVQARRLDASSLKKAQNLVEQATKQRPEWNEIHRLQAQLYLLQRRSKDAIASYELAFRYGPPDVASARLLHRLYLQTKQFVKARELQELLGPDKTGAIPLEQQAIVLMGRGEMEKAIVKAREAVSADPDNAAKHRWIAGMYLRANKKDRAETALREAVRLAPRNGASWLALIRLLVDRQKSEEAELELRKAHLHLSDDQLPLLLGQCNSILGRRREAEQYFLMAHRAKPDDLSLMQALVRYYVSSSYYAKDGRAKASVYLKKILAKAGDLPPTDPNVRWARRVTASLLADSGVHRDILRATKLMEKNVVNGQSLREDDLLIAALLGARGDAESHRKAIVAFENAKAKSDLATSHAVHLARLYSKTGEWGKCRSLMYDLYSTHGTDLQIIRSLCQMHLDRDEVREAATLFERMEKLAPDQPVTLALKVLLLSKQGNVEQARATVGKMMPTSKERKDLPLLYQLARLYEQIEQVDAAEQMYRRRVQIDSGAELELASFYGRQHDLKRAFDILDSMAIVTRNLSPIIRVGIQAVRGNRDDVGDTYDARIQQWLDKALRENPDSAPLLFELSELYEAQEKYDEAEKTYKRLVEHPDLDFRRRAIVANNLAFLLALQGTKPQQALEYVEQAIEVMGPTPALLDTRGCVYSAQANYDDAIHDFHLALEQLKDPSLYFHLALAQARSGDVEAAQITLNKAQKLGLTIRLLKPAERGSYEDLVRKLEPASAASAL